MGKSCWEGVTLKLGKGGEALGPLIAQIQSPSLRGLRSGFIATTIKIEKLIAGDRFSWYTERCFILKFVVLLVEQGAGPTCGPHCAIPASKGCLQEKEGSSAGRLHWLYWRSWALGQQRVPPPKTLHILLVCGYPRVLLTQTGQSGLVACPVQDSCRCTKRCRVSSGWLFPATLRPVWLLLRQTALLGSGCTSVSFTGPVEIAGWCTRHLAALFLFFC